MILARLRRCKAQTLGGNAERALAAPSPWAQEFRRGRIFQFSSEAGHMAGREGVEEGFQDNLRLSEASVEIIMLAFERSPASGRLRGQTAGNVSGCFAEFAIQLLKRRRKDAELVEKPGTFAEQHMMKDTVPRSGALSRIAAEKLSFEGFDHGKAADMTTAVRQNCAKRNERIRETPKKIRRDGYLLAGANQLTA